jgi:hypothetical protein
MSQTSTPAREKRHAIRTISGILFWPFEPRLEDIYIEDIAHALSQVCRFTGHTKQFYSVAQHSVLVSRLCEPEDALHGLLHDASEAYLGDVSRPIKHRPEFAAYRASEAQLQALIYQRFGLEVVEPASVKVADTKALHVELRDLMVNADPMHAAAVTDLPAIVGHRATLARDIFLQRFQTLAGKK